MFSERTRGFLQKLATSDWLKRWEYATVAVAADNERHASTCDYDEVSRLVVGAGYSDATAFHATMTALLLTAHEGFTYVNTDGIAHKGVAGIRQRQR